MLEVSDSSGLEGAFWDGCQNLVDHIIGADAFGLSFEIQNQTMSQNRLGHRFEVFPCDMEAFIKNRTNLGTEDQRLDAPGTGTETHKLFSRLSDQFMIGCVARTSAIP